MKVYRKPRGKDASGKRDRHEDEAEEESRRIREQPNQSETIKKLDEPREAEDEENQSSTDAVLESVNLTNLNYNAGAIVRRQAHAIFFQ